MSGVTCRWSEMADGENMRTFLRLEKQQYEELVCAEIDEDVTLRVFHEYPSRVT